MQKKQYTRKQIIESIKYWQNILSSMNESKNILLKEDDDMSNITPIPFPKDMIERYQDSKLIKFSNDGCSFSFSFGIPMPK